MLLLATFLPPFAPSPTILAMIAERDRTVLTCVMLFPAYCSRCNKTTLALLPPLGQSSYRMRLFTCCNAAASTALWDARAKPQRHASTLEFGELFPAQLCPFLSRCHPFRAESFTAFYTALHTKMLCAGEQRFNAKNSTFLHSSPSAMFHHLFTLTLAIMCIAFLPSLAQDNIVLSCVLAGCWKSRSRCNRVRVLPFRSKN